VYAAADAIKHIIMIFVYAYESTTRDLMRMTYYIIILCIVVIKYYYNIYRHRTRISHPHVLSLSRGLARFFASYRRRSVLGPHGPTPSFLRCAIKYCVLSAAPAATTRPQNRILSQYDRHGRLDMSDRSPSCVPPLGLPPVVFSAKSRVLWVTTSRGVWF